MTTEEKAKAYDEAIKRAREWEGSKVCIEYLFPGFAESEDERIREALITFFQKFPYGDIERAGTNVKEAIAWLEKQGEHSISDVPSREVILAIWQLGNDWKELTDGVICTEYGTQLDYIQKHWQESEYYLRLKQGK